MACCYRYLIFYMCSILIGYYVNDFNQCFFGFYQIYFICLVIVKRGFVVCFDLILGERRVFGSLCDFNNRYFGVYRMLNFIREQFFIFNIRKRKDGRGFVRFFFSFFIFIYIIFCIYVEVLVSVDLEGILEMK